MKKSLLIITLLFCATLLGAHSYAKSSGQSLDQIVAVVNDDVITKSELDHSLNIVKIQITQQNMPVPAENVLEKQVLEQLITKRLQLQVAKQAGITVTDNDLDSAIGNIAKQN